MADDKPIYEIIEDEPTTPQPKRKRYRRPLFGHIPWRWVGAAFAAGVLLVGAGALVVMNSSQTVLPVMVTPGAPLALTPVVVGEYVLDVAESGKWVALAGSSSLRLYHGGALVHLLDTYGDDPMHTRVAAVAFSPDGQQVVALRADNQVGIVPVATLKLYDVQSGELLRSLPAHEGSFADSYSGVSLTYSPDGKLLASGAGSGSTALWDMETGDLRGTLNTLATGTLAMAFSGDSQRLTIVTRLGSGYSPNHDSAQIQVWDVGDPAAGRQVMDRGASLDWPNAHLATLSADGRYAAFLVKERSIEFWDLDTSTSIGQLVFEPMTIIEGIAISPAGDSLAFIQRNIQLPSQTADGKVAETVTLRVVHWWQQENKFQFGDLYQPRELSARGAYQLHFSLDRNGIDYIPLDSHNFMKWDFDTGQTSVISF